MSRVRWMSCALTVSRAPRLSRSSSAGGRGQDLPQVAGELVDVARLGRGSRSRPDAPGAAAPSRPPRRPADPRPAPPAWRCSAVRPATASRRSVDAVRIDRSSSSVTAGEGAPDPRSSARAPSPRAPCAPRRRRRSRPRTSSSGSSRATASSSSWMCFSSSSRPTKVMQVLGARGEVRACRTVVSMPHEIACTPVRPVPFSKKSAARRVGAVI